MGDKCDNNSSSISSSSIRNSSITSGESTSTSKSSSSSSKSSTSTMEAEVVVAPSSSRIARPTLELRLKNQFKDDLFERVPSSNTKNGFLENTTTAASRSIAVEKEEESSVSRHHRQSISTTMSSTRGSSSTSHLRKSKAISSSSSSSSSSSTSEAAALLSRRSNISSDLSASSSRHYKTSVIVSGNASSAGSHTSHTIQRAANQQQQQQQQQMSCDQTGAGAVTESAESFLNSETTFSYLSCPDVLSLVKDIRTDFAELENAAIATGSASQFNHHQPGSISARFFGGRRLLAAGSSPTGSAPSAISDSSSHPTLYEETACGERSISPLFSRLKSSSRVVVTNEIDDNNSNNDTMHAATTGSTEPASRGRFTSYYLTTFGDNEPSSGPNGPRIKELMSKAQVHAERYGSSTKLETPQSPVPSLAAGSSSSSSSSSPSTLKSSDNASQVCTPPTITELPGEDLSADVAGGGKELTASNSATSASKQQEGSDKNKLHQNHRAAVMTESIENIDQKVSKFCKKFSECSDTNEAIEMLKVTIQMIEKAWSVPICGDDLGFKLCNCLREAGGLERILGFIHDFEEQQEGLFEAGADTSGQAERSAATSWATVMLGDEQADGQQQQQKLLSDNSAAGRQSFIDQQQPQPQPQPQQQHVQISRQQSNAQAKNNSSSNPLRLNLSKINNNQAASTADLMTASTASSQSAQVISSTDIVAASNKRQGSQSATPGGAKDSDSDILTSDLGLDSTSVESLSYVTAAQATPDGAQAAAAESQSGSSDLTKQQSSERDRELEGEGSSSCLETDASEGKKEHVATVDEESKTKIDLNETEDDLDLDHDVANESELQGSAPTTAASTVNELQQQHECCSGQQADAEETRCQKEELAFLSARLLSQCLTSDNRDYIVENGLCAVVRLACNYTTMKNSQSQRLLTRNLMVQQQHQQPQQQQLAAIKAIKRATGQQLLSQNNHRTTESPPNHREPVKSGAISTINTSQPLKLSQQAQQHPSSSGDKDPASLHSCHHSDMHAIIGTETLQHLFKHSEDTCSKIISLGGLQAILYGCRSSNVEILRHCASALANLALYGGSDSQQTMIEQKAHVWLFPLAFHEDDNVQYYACLAIAVLVANQEIEADVLKSSTLDLVEPFVTSHQPQKFAESTTAHIHGQSASWLRKLIPLLESRREEARNLACFHFAMEAYIKKEQGQTQVFKDIGAVEPLRKVGGSPIAIASKFACQALRLIGEKEPHKLSQQVPLWTSEDVKEWVCQIGFERFKPAFVESRVDGDLLLQLNEDMLTTDIGIDNGIIRRRFLRELSNLKRIADYSSVDRTGISSLLSSSGHDFVQYIYPMLQLGVTRDNIHLLDSEQLLRDCNIANTIHRMKLAHAIKDLQEKMAMEAASNECNSTDGGDQKTLDVFVSYRRANGSQLASLLKVHLQLRGFSVFIDVERLEAGKFDNNLLNSIKAAKNFILVLSPNALDRCIGDHECKDWVHKEIVAALASNCNIIPILDNFLWPDPEQLPEDMRSISYFNGVRWSHDYQDACVDKVERFIRGEINNGGSMLSSSSAQSSLQRGLPGASNYPSTPSIVATPSIAAFPSCGPASSRPPFDSDYHPLSFASPYLQQHSQNASHSLRRS